MVEPGAGVGELLEGVDGRLLGRRLQAVDEGWDALGFDDEDNVDRGGGLFAERTVGVVVLCAEFGHAWRDQDAAAIVLAQDLHQIEGVGEACLGWSCRRRRDR